MKIDSLNNINSSQAISVDASGPNRAGGEYKTILVGSTEESKCYSPGTISNLRDQKQDLKIVKQLFLIIDSLTEIDNNLGVKPTSEMLKEATTQIHALSEQLITPSFMLIVELVSLVFKGDDADADTMNKILKSITSKDPKIILLEINQLLYKRMQQLKVELSKHISTIDPNLLKLITKYIDELADQISTAVIMAISAVDQGLKAMRKLIDKILALSKEMLPQQGNSEISNIEKLLQKISDFLSMIDQILLFLIMQLAFLNKINDGDQNKI